MSDKVKAVKNRLRRFQWTDEIYDVLIVLLHGEWKPALAWMDTTFSEVSEQEVGIGEGAKTLLVKRERGMAIVLWFPRWFTTKNSKHLGVLAHECFHATEFLLRERGLTLTDSSDEAYAYYIAWLFRQCHRRLS